MAFERRILTLFDASTTGFDRGTSRMNRNLRRFERDTRSRLDRLDHRMSRLGSRFGINLDVRLLAGAAAAAAFSKAIGDLIRNGDKLRQLEGRFRALTGSAERARDLVQAAFGIGAETGAPLDAVTQSLTRFRLAADAIGATDQEVAKLTETVLKLGAIGGATTQELSSGAIQLGQGLASGRLQGEELRSILENLPLVARQIAEGLDASVGELREMGKEGQLTADRVFGALLSGADDVDSKFRELPQTVERSANQLANSWARFTAAVNESVGATDLLSAALSNAAENLNTMSDGLERAEENMRDMRILELTQEVNDLEDQLENLSDTARNLDFDLKLRDELAAARAELNLLLADANAGSAAAAQSVRDRLLEQGLRKGPGSRPRAGTFVRLGASLVAPGRAPQPEEPPPELGIPPLGGSTRAPRVDEEAVRILESLRERVELLREEQQIVGRSEIAQARLTAQFEKQRLVRELLAAAAKDNASITPQQLEEAQNLADEYERQTVALAELEQRLDAKREAEEEAAEAAKRHQEEMERVAASIFRAVSSARTFEEALDNVLIAITRILEQQISQRFESRVGGLFSDVFSGLFGGPSTFPASVHGANLTGLTFHSGGVVGRDGTPRTLPAATWMDAPRLHSGGSIGLRPNEVPAILERGEIVVPKDIGSARGTASVTIGDTNITITQPNMSESQLRRVLAEHRKETIREIVEMNDRDPNILHT